MGLDEKRRAGFYLIRLQTREVMLLLQATDMNVSAGEWSSDGRSILYVRWNASKNAYDIVKRSLDGSAEQEVYSWPVGAGGRWNLDLSVSPDGQWLSLINNRAEERVLRLTPAAGGSMRNLLVFKQSDRRDNSIAHAWTADGRFILFAAAPSKGPWSLYQIAVAGGRLSN